MENECGCAEVMIQIRLLYAVLQVVQVSASIRLLLKKLMVCHLAFAVELWMEPLTLEFV
jgi:hypothetical protein